MRQTKHVLFAFSPYTYKAVEAYLNRQAARGWALERIGPFEQLARFRRTDRTDLRCCTDLLPYRRGKKGRAKVEEYLALCREAGWELADRRGTLGVFVNRPGTDPAPIQTDREAERAHYRQVRRNSLFWVLIPLLIDLIYWIFLLWTGWRSGGGEWIEGLPLSLYVSWPRNWALIGLAAMLPLLAIPALLRLGGLAWSWVRAWRDRDIPTPAPWVMWGSALVNTAVLVVLWIVLVVVTMEAIKQGVISCFLGMFIGGVCLIGHAPAVERMTSHPGEAWRMRGRGTAFAALAAVVIVLTLTVGALTSSGAVQLLCRALQAPAKVLGIPEEVLPLALLRPLSGSGALVAFQQILSQYGPDSFVGRVASVLMGSTETTFYTIALYCSAANIKNSRYAAPASLCADLMGFAASAAAVRLLLG